MQTATNYIVQNLNITYSQLIDVLKKMPLEMKIDIGNVLEKEIDKKRKLPKGIRQATKKGSYTALFGLWSDMNMSVDEYRQSIWKRDNTL